MILILLRTGMRIGELLTTKLVDVHLADKKILIYEGEKNRKGRAVCISEDACQALADFLIAGRRLGAWVVAFSERASGESAWLLIGLPGLALASGFSAIWSAGGCNVYSGS